MDNRKAYDMVPHSSVIKSLNIMGIAENLVNNLGKIIKSWRDWPVGAEKLGKVPIKRGIFHGDALSPLLFVITLIPLTLILRRANPWYEFQTGETINHMLFMDDLKLHLQNEHALDSLIQTVRIFREDIGMQFRINVPRWWWKREK